MISHNVKTEICLESCKTFLEIKKFIEDKEILGMSIVLECDGNIINFGIESYDIEYLEEIIKALNKIKKEMITNEKRDN